MRKLILALTLLLCSNSLALAKDLQVGFVYVSPIGNEGLNYMHDQARLEVEKLEGVSTSFVENVNEGPDAERVILNMARRGSNIIFTESFGYMDSTLKVAKQFPDATFLHFSGYKDSENMSNFFGRIYQSRYLTGMVAGAMTKSNIVGYVAAFPIPEVIRGINAFALGVQSVNPDAKVNVVWSNSWYDPATEKEAAKSLFDIGADIITQHQDSPAVQEAAEERGIYSIGYHSDMSKIAPKAHLTAAIWDWRAKYLEIVKAIQDGTWKNGSYWWSMADGVVDIAPFSSVVPKELQEQVNSAKADIIANKLVVFTGPIKDQSGAERISAGLVPSDAELLSMDWFVQGVVGSVK